MSFAGLLFGATGAFVSLQSALNRAWEVEPDPKQGGIRNFIMKRFLSLAMVLGIAFLLLVSLALTSALSAAGGALFGGLPEAVGHAINFVLSFAVVTLLFAGIFKLLPDAKIAWRDVWVGAAVTAMLFVIGKFVIGLYIGRSDPGSAFGAASALAVLLVWIYYAAVIVLLGAEFTQAWVKQRGRDIEPKEGAVRVVERVVGDGWRQPPTTHHPPLTTLPLHTTRVSSDSSRMRLRSMVSSFTLAGALAAILVLGASVAVDAQRPRATPAAVFVTWNGDPTTSVSVDWHLAPGRDIRAIEVRGPGLTGWRRQIGVPVKFPFSSRTVRRAQITGLRPERTYELRIGGSRIYRYRTMPARLTRPVRFAAGGDTQAAEADFGPMNRIAAARDVDFVLLGGDLAYSNGDPRLVAREQTWFETVTRTLVTREGRLIPVIAAIGNHEVFSSRDTAAATIEMIRRTGVKLGESPYYSALHAHARDRKYQVVDVGDYLSLVLLNTGHTAEVGGAQTEWLKGVLATRAAVPHVFPIYHVPGYPSVRAFEAANSTAIRTNWAPVFEQSRVRVAFENHDHAYKRTIPLRAGVRDSTGVIYVGDGAWGAPPRSIGRDQTAPVTYLEKSRSTLHGIFVTLDRTSARMEMVDTARVVFDTLVVPARNR